MNDNSMRVVEWEDRLHREPWAAKSGWRFCCLEEAETTMTVARGLPERSSPQCVMARRQTHGRGREGRQWLALPNSFAATYVFPLCAGADRLSGFSCAVGVLVAEALDPEGRGLMVKWPNDLVTSRGEKVGGILIEVLRSSHGAMLIGMGINLEPIPAGLPDADFRFSSVADALSLQLTPVGCAAVLSASLWEGFLAQSRQGLTPFLDGWRSRDFLRGRQLELLSGGERVRGRAAGISETGALRVDCEGRQEEQKEIVSGHILQWT